MTTTTTHSPAGAFHEWPLVVFTTLAIMGAGLLATPLVAWLAAGVMAPAAGAVRWGALLLGAGLVVSTVHLGRPLRAPLAALGVGRSRLSAEIVAAGIALMLGTAAVVIPHVSTLPDFAAAAAAVGFLAALGLVYSLPGQQTWRGAVVWMPLTAGLGFSAAVFGAIWSGPPAAVTVAAVGILAADTALLAVRRMSLTDPRMPLARRYPSIFARRQMLLAARLALVDILPACCLLAGLPSVAAGLLTLGILVDRIGFYGFASQHTTEAEVQRVEAVLGSRG